MHYNCNAMDLIMQVIFNKLYKHGSNLDKGCLLQLRNLINRRNVASDTTGRFNATVDFFELVVEFHITAAAMDYNHRMTLQ